MIKARTIILLITIFTLFIYIYDVTAYKNKAETISTLRIYRAEIEHFDKVNRKVNEYGALIEELDKQIDDLKNNLTRTNDKKKQSKIYKDAQRFYLDLLEKRKSLSIDYEKRKNDYLEQRDLLTSKYHDVQDKYNDLRHPILFRKKNLPRSIMNTITNNNET